MLLYAYSLVREGDIERQKPAVRGHKLALACSFFTLHSGKNRNTARDRASSPLSPFSFGAELTPQPFRRLLLPLASQRRERPPARARVGHERRLGRRLPAQQLSRQAEDGGGDPVRRPDLAQPRREVRRRPPRPRQARAGGASLPSLVVFASVPDLTAAVHRMLQHSSSGTARRRRSARRRTPSRASCGATKPCPSLSPAFTIWGTVLTPHLPASSSSSSSWVTPTPSAPSLHLLLRDDPH